MSGKPQIDGCRVVALGDAWAYGQGQITWNELEARAHAVPAEAQPGEWVLVPREPTQAMLDAGHWPCVQGRGAKSVWATMLAAAPQPPAEAQPVAYADPQAFANFKERGHLGGPHGREWMWAKPDAGLVPVYAHPPPSTPEAQGGGEVEYEFEVWQDDSLLAGGSTSDYATAKSEADHYALMYGQDGPVEVRMYVKRQITSPPSAPVGVVGVRHEIQNALRELDAVMTAEDNTSDAVGCAELALQRALEALAQQPAPVAPVGVAWPLSLLRSGHWHEVYVGRCRCMRLEVTYAYATWGRLMEQVEAALAPQPAAPRNSSGHCPDSSGHSRVESILLRAGFNPDEAARIAARAVQQGGAAR